MGRRKSEDGPEEIDDEKSPEEMQAELTKVQLETAYIQRDQARESAQHHRETKEAVSRRNKQRQVQLAQERATEASLIATCNHKQGGTPDNLLEGDGKSALMRARIFFAGNEVVFCLRCPLRISKPHPALKKVDPKRYERDLKYYEGLIKESKSNQLNPMIGPQFEFINEDGVSIMPELR